MKRCATIPPSIPPSCVGWWYRYVGIDGGIDQAQQDKLCLTALQPSIFILDQLIKTLLEHMFSSQRFQKFALNENGKLTF